MLFLEPTARGDFSILSWEQGTFRIRRDASTAQETVTQDTASFATFDPASRRFESAESAIFPSTPCARRPDAAMSAGRRGGSHEASLRYSLPLSCPAAFAQPLRQRLPGGHHRFPRAAAARNSIAGIFP